MTATAHLESERRLAHARLIVAVCTDLRGEARSEKIASIAAKLI